MQVSGRYLIGFGAIAAVLFAQRMTSSGFPDIGGAVDVIVLLAVAVAGGDFGLYRAIAGPGQAGG